MKYSSQIHFKTQNKKELLRIFKTEESEKFNDRASWHVQEDSEGLVFHIKAKESVALRAVLNTITKLLTVHEKMQNI